MKITIKQLRTLIESIVSEADGSEEFRPTSRKPSAPARESVNPTFSPISQQDFEDSFPDAARALPSYIPNRIEDLAFYQFSSSGGIAPDDDVPYVSSWDKKQWWMWDGEGQWVQTEAPHYNEWGDEV